MRRIEIVTTREDIAHSMSILFKGECEVHGLIYSIEFPHRYIIQSVEGEIEEKLDKMIENLNNTHIREYHGDVSQITHKHNREQLKLTRSSHASLN